MIVNSVTMPSLAGAHQGYGYQDLLVAGRMVDMLLGGVIRMDIEKKFVSNDPFDDLTTVDFLETRERVQVKYTADTGRSLSASIFTGTARRLRLDGVFAGMMADRDKMGASVGRQIYRIVFVDQPPTNGRFTEVLIDPPNDPGPFLPGLQTVRFSFDADALWAQMGAEHVNLLDPGRPFAFLRETDPCLRYSDLVWACSNLFVECGSPPMSGDLTRPGAAEALVLGRVAEEVGAGLFPNEHRSVVDVAGSMIAIAQAARQDMTKVTADEILRRAQLRSDFGSVSRGYPVDPSTAIHRETAVAHAMASVNTLVGLGGTLLMVGPPGQGKSWLSNQIVEELGDLGWLVAEHYCYLGEGDHQKSARVLEKRIFGSLLGRLSEADPRLVEELRPRLAADEEALIRCLERSVSCEPDRRIALLVDGIDHVTRVRNGRAGDFDPSRSLAGSLAALDLPRGVVLIVLSQPGPHLEPLRVAGATIARVGGFDREETRILAERQGLIPESGIGLSGVSGLTVHQRRDAANLVDALVDRSAGNALYITYLCRQVSNSESTIVDLTETLREMPAFDGTLENYYEHLCASLDAVGGWVADIISLADFAVTRAELCEMRPDMVHRVDRALDVLAPVLMERATQGGLRVYHESFARYLRRSFQDNSTAYRALVEQITGWLREKGFFEDSRSFYSLLPLLAKVREDREVKDIVDQHFVANAIVAGFPASAVIANLATAITCAARIGEWPAVVRFVEMSRAAELYQKENVDYKYVEYSDVPITLLGAAKVAERLLYENRLVMPSRAGIQICGAVDAQGGVAPWAEYLEAYVREGEFDSTSYGEESDLSVSLACLRGRLRLAVAPFRNGKEADRDLVIGESGGRKELIDWHRVAAFVDQSQIPMSDVAQTIIDTNGTDKVVNLIDLLEKPGGMCLALAEYFVENPGDSGSRSPRQWAMAALDHGVPPGELHRIFGFKPDVGNLSEYLSRDELFDLTRQVQEPSIQGETGRVQHWLDICAAAAQHDPLGLNTAEALVTGEGWYRCWLRFAIGLSRAEAADMANRSALAVEALGHLTKDLNPFTGDPRACDLFLVHQSIASTIKRAVALVHNERLREVFGLLYKVSRSVGTTLMGSDNNPVPLRLIMDIAVENKHPESLSIARVILEEELVRYAAGRPYPDLAELYLIRARLALADADNHEALLSWQKACAMLIGYGWHKDVTIYELLDPTPHLVSADPSRGKECLRIMQPLCERVSQHIGRGAGNVLLRWWNVLSEADPSGLAHLASTRLFRECNDPNWARRESLRHMWRMWSQQADPLLAGLLRLALDIPIETDDAVTLSRLVETAGTDDPALISLMTWLLARADERPLAVTSSTDADLPSRGDQEISRLNAVAERANLPQVMATRDYEGEFVRPSTSYSNPLRSTGESVLPEPPPPGSFAPGAAGLSQAIREWRRCPSNPTSPGWSVERFADTILNGIVQLVEAGRQREAEIALLSLAKASEVGGGVAILNEIAARLHHLGHDRLSTIAYTLSWTRTRGQGGWLTFGGETNVASLHRASEKDPIVTLQVVGEEVARIVLAGDYTTNGITRALVYAFCVGALKLPEGMPVDTAFAMWDEAFTIIDSRAPWVHHFDDPKDLYIPNRTGSAACQDDVDMAFALGLVACLSHPGREQKRRTMLATQLLLSRRPNLAAEAIHVALANLSDPATITWLLCHLQEAAGTRSELVVRWRESLVKLANSEYLTVRSLARLLLGDNAPPLTNSTPAAQELLEGTLPGLWIAGAPNQPASHAPAGLDQMIAIAAGSRLSAAEPLLPGIGSAVYSRVALRLSDDIVNQRLNQQLDAYADQNPKRWPDAYLVPEQTIEEEIQRVATGWRVARITAGQPIADPVASEHELAGFIVDNPRLPLALEACRTPRPPIPLPPSATNDIWASIPRHASHSQMQPIFLNLETKSASETQKVERGPFRNWAFIGTIEKRLTHERPEVGEIHPYTARYRAIEIRDPSESYTINRPPFPDGDIRQWWETSSDPNQDYSLGHAQPLLGLDMDLIGAADAPHGLGMQSPLLAPTVALKSILNLNPGHPLTLKDCQGTALVLLTWRAAYETGHTLRFPYLIGSAVIIRPDLFTHLTIAFDNSLFIRDFASKDP